MSVDKKRRLRPFARNLSAALAAHRMRVSFRTATEKYTPAEVEEGWYWLDESLERMSIASLEEFMRDDPSGTPSGPVQ